MRAGGRDSDIIHTALNIQNISNHIIRPVLPTSLLSFFTFFLTVFFSFFPPLLFIKGLLIPILLSVIVSTVPPPEERNRLWMVEAEISPEMIKRKKKKKKRKKEVRPVKEVVDHQVYHQREFGRSSVPRLPKLPCHPSLVANLREQQRQQQKLEEEVLPGSYPDFQTSHPLSREERCPYPPYQSGQNSYGRRLLSNPVALNDRPEDLGLGPRCPPSACTWQPSGSSHYPGEVDLTDGLSERLAHVARVPAGRRAGYGPIHSQTNLMEAELMDADSDF